MTKFSPGGGNIGFIDFLFIVGVVFKQSIQTNNDKDLIKTKDYNYLDQVAKLTCHTSYSLTLKL